MARGTRRVVPSRCGRQPGEYGAAGWGRVSVRNSAAFAEGELDGGSNGGQWRFLFPDSMAKSAPGPFTAPKNLAGKGLATLRRNIICCSFSDAPHTQKSRPHIQSVGVVGR
jgi:hypothetical protein